MRQTIRTLQAAGAGLAGSGRAVQPQRKPTHRATPTQQPEQRDNRAFAPDDDDEDDERWGGDELQSRFDQYPEQHR